MPITFNGTTISGISFNGNSGYGTSITTVVFNGTTVYSFNPTIFDGLNFAYTENVSLVTGFISGGSVTENLYNDGGDFYYTRLLTNNVSGTTESTWVTDLTVDLTNYSTLNVNWRNVGTSNVNVQTIIVVSTAKTSSSATFTARTVVTGQFTGFTNSTLNISSLTGPYFIRVHSRKNTTTTGIISDVEVRKIWLT